jgi:uncharacterized membrane protein YeiB
MTIGATQRINTLDTIRGSPVLGILLMHIVDLAMQGARCTSSPKHISW